MRYFIELAYNGKDFNGWQRQPNAPSVQQTLEEALSTLMRTPIDVVGAGRTDTGVHAQKMFAHFDWDTKIEDCEQLCYQLNQFLPNTIAIRSIRSVIDSAHARFDALQRTYEYHISFEKDPFDAHGSYKFGAALDLDRMHMACDVLMKHRDFECFSKSKTDVKTYICEITAAHWKPTERGLVFTISANRFLRNMVRAIVGTLLEIGQGKKTVEQLEAIIASKNRSEAGYSVPAQGLYLTDITYPQKIFVDG